MSNVKCLRLKKTDLKEHLFYLNSAVVIHLSSFLTIF